MVTVQLMGGIGNQLFQVATAYAIAKENNDTLILSTDGWHALTGEHPSKYRDTIFKNFQFTDEPLNYPVFRESDYLNPIKYNKNIKLLGYFQNPLYFDKYGKEFCNMLNFDGAEPVRPFITPGIVSLHVRRGDYVRLSHLHPPVTVEYINKAIETMDENHHVYMIWLFSDDIKWCEKNVRDDRVYILDSGDDVQNLYTMSMADHHIISNSSYSWWGAYLHKNLNNPVEHTVIAPALWYGKGRTTNIHFPNTVKL